MVYSIWAKGRLKVKMLIKKGDCLAWRRCRIMTKVIVREDTSSKKQHSGRRVKMLKWVRVGKRRNF